MIFLPSVVLLAILSSSQATLIDKRDSLVSCLKASLSLQGAVLLPNDTAFVADTTRFTSWDVPSFKVVSQVANEGDVRISIQCANKTGTPFLVTGPRHGAFEGFSNFKNGLEIFTGAVGAFDSIAANPYSNTMTIGGAAVFKNVANALQSVKKQIPVGGGPCVGMVGATMGAGIGRLEGLFGLMSDSLLSVYLMLPDTTVIEVSETQEPELFWGLRGSGFNFGFVLNATYRVYDAAPGGNNLNADFLFPLSAVRSFYQALHDNVATLPAPLCLSTDLSWNPSLNMTTLAVNAVYAGPYNEGVQAVEFLNSVGPLLQKNFTEIPWNQIYQNAFFLDNNALILECGGTFGVRKPLAAAFNVVDVDAHVNMSEQFDYMVKTYPQVRGSDNSMYFCATQAVRALPDDATAYPWRQAVGHHTWGIVYGDNTTDDATIQNIPEKMRSTIAASAGTHGLNTYIGFSNGDESLEALYSAAHLPRLVALKKKYDPFGLFNAYHPLPTSYP